MLSTLPVLLLLLTFTATISAAVLDLQLSNNGTTFAISHDGKPMLTGSTVNIDGFSLSKKTLMSVGHPTKAKGTDPLGDYQATTVSFAKTTNPTNIIMKGTYKTYPMDAGLIVFTQTFPQALRVAPSTMDAAPKTAKPSCRVVAKSTPVVPTPSESGYIAYTPYRHTTNVQGYDRHDRSYCGTTPQHTWTHTGNDDPAGCQALCDKIDCACYDVLPSTANDLKARTIFPGFDRTASGQRDLDCFAYHDVFPAMKGCTLSTYQESHVGGAPLAFYDGTNASLPMVVFSPLDSPLAHHMASDSTFVGAGVKATVLTIPAGWTQSFLLSAGTGVRQGMMAWGDRMLRFTGKPRADMYKDDTHGKIGFWTDNGGFYHYSIGENRSLGTNYEQVLPKVKAWHDEIGIPFAHWQFDSWFYPKDGGVNPGGGGGAVTNWTADPSIFPHGMQFIQEQLGKTQPNGHMPIVMHNRQWSDHSDYIKHLPFQWYISKFAVPKDPEAFFDWFFQQQPGWGLSMYEQDWMCTEYDGVTELQSNVTMGDLWLKGMADGAEKSGRTVQYCMPYPNQVLSASAYGAVTNARATGDYFHADHQWAVGATSLFYWAIGILPFKDGFYSSTHKQIGGQTVGPELNPDREALMATLSCAMVGAMDGIGLLNKTRVMTTCTSDGTVLKPDVPVHTSDYCFYQQTKDPGTCFIYHTWSEVKGVGKLHYHYNDNAGIDFTPTMVHLALTDVGKYVVRNWYTGELSLMNTTNSLRPGYEDHVYATISPVGTNGWVFLGEVNKYVVGASKRFGAVTYLPWEGGTSMNVEVMGNGGESVTVCAANTINGVLKEGCNTVKFEKTATRVTTFK